MKKGYIPRLMSSDALSGYVSRLHFLTTNSFLEQRWARIASITGITVLSLFFLGYGFWLLQLERGARAAAQGEIDAATAL